MKMRLSLRYVLYSHKFVKKYLADSGHYFGHKPTIIKNHYFDIPRIWGSDLKNRCRISGSDFHKKRLLKLRSSFISNIFWRSSISDIGTLCRNFRTKNGHFIFGVSGDITSTDPPLRTTFCKK